MSGLVASGLSVTQVFSGGRTSAAVQLMWWAAEPRLSRGLSQGEMPVLRAGPGLRRCFRARFCVGATETGVLAVATQKRLGQGEELQQVQRFARNPLSMAEDTGIHRREDGNRARCRMLNALGLNHRRAA